MISSFAAIVVVVSLQCQIYITNVKSFSLDAKATKSAFTKDKSIDCKHFEECAGCITNEDLKDVEAVRRVKQYFTSNVTNKHRINNDNKKERKEDDSNDGDKSKSDLLFPIQIPSKIINWRTQARVAVAPHSGSTTYNGKTSGCKLGLYERGSHEVMSIDDCRVHDLNINKAIQLVEKATIKVRINAYDEIKLIGELRYVQFQVERRTGKVILVLVWNGEKLKDCQPSISRLVKQLKKIAPSDNFWHSIWLHCNTSPTNNIFARGEYRWHLLFGPEHHTELLPGSSEHDKKLLFFKPMVFRQANLDGFSNIALKICEFIPNNSNICELYAGIGVIGLTILNQKIHSIKSLKCSDENPSNEKCFHRSLNTILPKDENDNKVTYKVASASQALKQGEALNSNILIVDPPRKGLDEFVIDQLCQQPKKLYVKKQKKQKRKQRDDDEKPIKNYVADVNTLIYVSCGYKALLRDCDKLLSSSGGGSNGWKIFYSTGYVLFPGSDHIESLIVFKR